MKKILNNIQERIQERPWLCLGSDGPCRFIPLGSHFDLLPSNKHMCPKSAAPLSYTAEEAKADDAWLALLKARLADVGLELAGADFGRLDVLYAIERKGSRPV